MKMVLKIIIFGALLFGTVILERTYLQPKKIMVPILFYCLGLLGAYLLLLYLEIRLRIMKAASQKQLRWAGFHFTFWTGLFWGVFIAFPASDSWFADPRNFFGLLGGLIASGIIFGLFGMAITQFMLLLVFKQRDST